VREVLADPDTPYLDGSRCVGEVVSEPRRVARGSPTIICSGFLKGYGLKRRREARFRIEDPFTSEFGPFAQRRVVSDRKLTEGLFRGIPPQIVGTAQAIILGLVGDWGAYMPGAATPAEKGIVPVYVVGNRNFLGSDWTEFFVCGHAIENLDVYGADPTNTFRTKALASDYGSTILAPKKTGWPFADNYFDYTDTDTGLVHRCTTFFIRADSIMSISHLNGQISVAVNVCGMEENGDASGRVVTGFFYAWQLLFDNFMAPNPGYYTGLYGNAPLGPGGVRMTNSASFAAAQATSARFIGGEGYQVGCVINDPGLSNLEIQRRFAVSSGAEWYRNKAGQMSVALFDTTMSTAGLPVLRQPSQLRAGVAPEYESGYINNPVHYNYDKDYDKNRWRAPQSTVRNTTIIPKTGHIERPATVDLLMVRDPATANAVAGQRLLRRRQPPQIVELEMHDEMGGLDFEVADFVKVESLDGPGAGYDDAVVRLLRHDYRRQARMSTWTGEVVDEQLQALIPLTASGTIPLTSTGTIELRS
jgi:hypothetical protein